MTGLPLRARLVIGLAAGAGLAMVAWAALDSYRDAHLSLAQASVWWVFGLALMAAWLWPLRIYRDGHSEALHVDEGFFILMVLLLPSWTVLLAFASTTVVAQVIRRRPLVKMAFNSGQVLAATGAGLVVAHRFGSASGPITPAYLVGAVLGAAAYFAVNSAAFMAIMGALGTSARRALLDGLEVRLLLVGAGVVVALIAALCVQAYPWSVPLAAIPFGLLPRVLSGHFKAREDRNRLRGLFDATLEAHRQPDADRIRRVVSDAARRQLNCSLADFADHPPSEGLSATVVVNGAKQWLSVAGRTGTAAFEEADQALLDALAAVGAGALSNAALYQETHRQRERLATITSSLGEGVCAISASGAVTFVNPAAVEMLGWTVDPPSGLPVGGSGLAPSFLLIPAVKAMETMARVVSYDSQFERRGGAPVDVAYTASPIAGPDGAEGAVIVFRDITERKRFEEQLSKHAFHDALTGLANRRLFMDHLRHALGRSERSGERHAVLFADVDRFKLVNDGLGHQAGDQLLIAIARCMESVLRPGDVIARFGGDEFTILLEGVHEEWESIAVAKRVTERLSEPITLADGHEVVATVSIGIALTDPGDNPDDVLRNADVAMYSAKRRGRMGGYQVFDGKQMGVRSSERIDLEAALRRALERDEIEVFFQPVYSSVTGRIEGAEALIRWHHPERGLILPGEFVPLAEECGLILPLGRHVLEEACRWARRWRESLGAELMISVNLSGRQFQHSGLELEVAETLHRTGVDPHQLCLEITESVAVDDIGRTHQVLTGLRELGVRVAIDDFGTGYSSLAYLNKFPVDVVKIDRSFVERLGEDAISTAIVSAVISLSDAIGTTTVAEGLETEDQLDRLRSLGCPLLQGYLLARPMPAAALEALLVARAGNRVILENRPAPVDRILL
ncbi:MAG TPA: EAL domain-containing protein [Acidimicrobiales bacterium]|nr:EAL domain-containing protein [Acidimicrobiales bacterium]